MSEEPSLTMNELPEILNAKQIAKYLGVSVKVVYVWLSQSDSAGGLKCLRIGKICRVKKKDFVSWLDSKNVS